MRRLKERLPNNTFNTCLYKHWSTPTRRRPATPGPSGRARRVQHHHDPYEPLARSARGWRPLSAGRAAHGLARDAMPEERRCNQPRRVPLPLTRLGAERVCGLPVAAAQHARGVGPPGGRDQIC